MNGAAGDGTEKLPPAQGTSSASEDDGALDDAVRTQGK